MEGENSLWYPTMKLFRQNQADDWAELMGRAAEALVAAVQPL